MFGLPTKIPELEKDLFIVLTNYMHQGSIYRVAPMVCMDIRTSTHKGVRLSRHTTVCNLFGFIFFSGLTGP